MVLLAVLGPVVRGLRISSNPRLNLIHVSFLLFIAFSRIIFPVLFRASYHQIVDKKTSTEVTFYAFISGFKFCLTNRGL